MSILWALVWLSCTLLQKQALGVHFIGIGDWGDDTPTGIQSQKEVAVGLNNWCGTHDCNFIFDAGDNFYEEGVTSATDPRFDTSWRWIYNHTNIGDKRWYITLGNHDHGPDDGREQFQVQFGQTEPLWYFPSIWYDAHHVVVGSVTMHFIHVDTESIRLNKNDPAAQLAWLEATLAASTEDWRIVVMHHPPYSAAFYGPTLDFVVDQILPILLQNGADLLVTGHDHNLQHITPADGAIDYIITGAGGRGLYPLEPANEQALNALGLQVNYFGFVHGFVAFDFTSTSYTAEFVDKNGVVGYTYTRIR